VKDAGTTLTQRPLPDVQARSRDELAVSVVIPCLNEEENIEACVQRATAVLVKEGISGEVIVVDNGSEDRSADLARGAGARVVHEPRRGYGSAYLTGLAHAAAQFVVMADADLTYDFGEIPRFLERLQSGADLVMGDRMDNIAPGAMPWLHRYVGNPALTGVLNLFFRTGVRDAHCGMRAVRRDVLPRLDLRTTGMEFASEMIVRAAREGLVIEELPIKYYPRGGRSKLSSFRDGWRHLRYLLVHSPRHLFIVPGAVMFGFGLLVWIPVLAGINIFGRHWDLHTLIAGSLLMIVGTQVSALGICAQAYATYYMNLRDPWFDALRARFRLEHGLMLGGLVFMAGGVVCAVIVIRWAERGFGDLAEEKLALVGATLLILGVQIFFASFLLSILGLRRRETAGGSTHAGAEANSEPPGSN
jgi:glycosyltransferase involved in cell wall biosynthesis